MPGLRQHHGGQSPAMRATATPLQVTMIPRRQIMEIEQPRKKFVLDDLLESFRTHGFTLSAIVVRKRPGEYYLEHDEALGLWNFCHRDAEGNVHRLATDEKKSEADKRLDRDG